MATPSFKQFLKDNVGGKLGAAVTGASAVGSIAAGEPLLKTLLKTLKDIAIWRLTLATGFASLFTGMGKSIRSVVKDTGSLEAALKRLAKIEGLQNTFKPLVGGAAAAKKAIAELVNFAASKNLALEEVGEAARSLQIMTRGAYSGTKALDTLNDAAAVSGNKLTTLADAVGSFSSTLREGGSIHSAAEELRQMGAISQGTADQLDSLQQNGASAGQVFDTLTDSLEKFKGGASEAAKEIENVNREFEAAKTALQEKFASPFTAEDVQNTANWTAAMQAVAPAVQSVSQFLHDLFGGFSNIGSATAKWIAQFPGVASGLGLIVKGLGIVIAAVGVLSAAAIPAAVRAVNIMIASLLATIPAAGAAGVAVTALSLALRGLVALTGFGAVIMVLITAFGAVMNFIKAADAEKKALDELAKAHDETTSALAEQIDKIQSLTDRHEALVDALKAETQAQIELNAAMKDGDPKKIAEARRNLADKERKRQDAESSLAGQMTPAERALFQKEKDREEGLAEQDYQNKLSAAAPEQRQAMMEQHAAVIQGRSDKGEMGFMARAVLGPAQAKADDEVAKAREELERIQKEDASQGEIRGDYTREINAAKTKLFAATSRRDAIGLGAPEGSSIQLEALSRQQSDPKEKSLLREKAERAKALEDNFPQLSEQASGESAASQQLKRENDMARERARIEKEIAGIQGTGFEREQAIIDKRLELLEKEKEHERNRPGGPDQAELDRIKAQESELGTSDLERARATATSVSASDRELQRQRATISGDSGQITGLDNLQTFADKFSELAPKFGDLEAEKRAREFANNSISLSANQNQLSFNSRVAASDLAKIGGGGNIEDASSDPLLSVSEQVRDLTAQSNKYLEQISKVRGVWVLRP